MPSRRLLSILIVPVVAAALGAGPAAASPSAATAARRYTSHQVITAFRTVKIRLENATYGELQPVASLTEVSPPRKRSWTVAAYVYPTTTLAARSYRSNVDQWRSSGFASTKLRNIVVVAVPKGHVLGVKAKPWPMPQQVRSALTALTGA